MAGSTVAVVAAHGPRVQALQAHGFVIACPVVSRFLAITGGARLVESAVLVLPLMRAEP
jgi:hypothetical protein